MPRARNVFRRWCCKVCRGPSTPQEQSCYKQSVSDGTTYGMTITRDAPDLRRLEWHVSRDVGDMNAFLMPWLRVHEVGDSLLTRRKVRILVVRWDACLCGVSRI